MATPARRSRNELNTSHLKKVGCADYTYYVLCAAHQLLAQFIEQDLFLALRALRRATPGATLYKRVLKVEKVMGDTGSPPLIIDYILLAFRTVPSEPIGVE